MHSFQACQSSTIISLLNQVLSKLVFNFLKIMQKIIILMLIFFHVCSVSAQRTKSYYQIDMILFIHENNIDNKQVEPYFNNNNNAFLLKNSGSTNLPYRLLPAKLSQLQREYYALRRKPEYQVISYSSWLQPANKHQAIIFPANMHGDWEVQGTLDIRQSNYYLLNTKLYISKIDHSSPFLFEKNERLNGNTIYYLDHPQAGMIIKIHKLS